MTLWAHVPTPLAPQQSSLFVVIQNLCTQRRADGKESAVVVSDNREIHLQDTSLHPVDYTRYCPRQWFTPREGVQPTTLGNGLGQRLDACTDGLHSGSLAYSTSCPYSGRCTAP